MAPKAILIFEIPNLFDQCCYENLTGSNEKDSTNRSEFFNILEHESQPVPPCVKSVSRASTTYRDHYCQKKGKPETQKICLPRTAIHTSGDKITTITTYKEDYHPYKVKEQRAYKGELIPQKQNLKCERAKFEGKSETKSTFRCPKLKSQIHPQVNVASPRKGAGKYGGQKAFATTTTYSSEFKKPKRYLKTASFTSKSNFTFSREPFKHISQYMNEFRAPEAKKSASDWRFKRASYRPPSVPMEGMTTYNASFTFKIPTSKPLMKRYPDYRCKECTRFTIHSKKPDYKAGVFNLGDGDKAETMIHQQKVKA